MKEYERKLKIFVIFRTVNFLQNKCKCSLCVVTFYRWNKSNIANKTYTNNHINHSSFFLFVFINNFIILHFNFIIIIFYYSRSHGCANDYPLSMLNGTRDQLSRLNNISLHVCTRSSREKRRGIPRGLKAFSNLIFSGGISDRRRISRLVDTSPGNRIMSSRVTLNPSAINTSIF